MTDRTAQLNLAELFVSIQGEGRYLGMPSVFVRTSGCNLRCEWNRTRCDTPYTSWDARSQLTPVAEIRDRVRALRQAHPAIVHAVVTGGEPLLQPALDVLLHALRDDGCFITLETNGTLMRELAVDFVSVSPKLRSSLPADPQHAARHDAARHRPDALRFWLTRYDCQLKFVIQEAADEAEIAALLHELNVPVAPASVYLLPQGVATPQLAEHGRLCVEMCLRRGWRYTPRAHIEIYGNTPGT
jgi:7-carboxy-7-deazaguanine synthase